MKTNYQSLNTRKVDIGSKLVKSSQIDFKNVEKMVDSFLSQRLSGFITRIDEIESKFTENQKKIELDEGVKEMVTETNNISTKIDNSHIETYRELEKIFHFLKTRIFFFFFFFYNLIKCKIYFLK